MSDRSYDVYYGHYGDEGWQRLLCERFDWMLGAFNERMQRYSAESTDVLDFGCGQGLFGELLSKEEHEGIDLVAVEPESVAGGNFYAQIVQDISDIPESMQFDVIVAGQVFEHVEDLDETLRELRKRLRHDGCLIATFPVGKLPHKDHVRTLTALGVRQSLWDAGFTSHTAVDVIGRCGWFGIVLDGLPGATLSVVENKRVMQEAERSYCERIEWLWWRLGQ